MLLNIADVLWHGGRGWGITAHIKLPLYHGSCLLAVVSGLLRLFIGGLLRVIDGGLVRVAFGLVRVIDDGLL